MLISIKSLLKIQDFSSFPYKNVNLKEVFQKKAKFTEKYNRHYISESLFLLFKQILFYLAKRISQVNYEKSNSIQLLQPKNFYIY